MTVEDARRIVVEYVSDYLSRNPNEKGMLGSELGQNLSSSGHRLVYRNFGSKGLLDFLRSHCTPPLVLSFEGFSGDPMISLEPGTPRLLRKKFVDPSVWHSSINPSGRQTYVNPDGKILQSGIKPEGDWTKIPLMSHERQLEILERGRLAIMASIPTNHELWPVIFEAMGKARASKSPILEFSKTMSALFRTSSVWHDLRVREVFEFVRESTGVELREIPKLPVEPPTDVQKPNFDLRGMFQQLGSVPSSIR
jgi:hypothetical protein